MANTLQEEANFSRVGRIVLDLNSKVQREYLSVIVPPKTLPSNIFNLKVLNQQQKTIIQNITNKGSYDKCDSSLLYILIRNLCNVVPANGWSKPVQASSIGVADDIERLRVFRNELYGHAITAKLSNADFNQFIQDVKGIMTRFDSCHGGTYQACPSTGSYTNELINIITSPMDPVLQNYYKTHLIQLLNLQTTIALHDTKIKTMTEDIKNIAADVSNQVIKTKMVGTNMLNMDDKIDNVERNLVKDLSTQNIRIGCVINDVVDLNVRIDVTEADIVVQKDEQIKVMERVDITEAEIILQKDEQVKIKKRVDATETDIAVQKDEQIKVMKRVDITEHKIVAQKEEQIKLKKRVDVTETDIAVQKDEQMKVKERLDVTEANIVVQKDEQIKVIKRVDATEAEIVAQKEEQVKVKKRVDVNEADIAVQKDEQMKVKERLDFTEADIVVQKDEQIKVIKRVDVTEAEIIAQKDEQVKVKKRVDVTETDIAVQKDEQIKVMKRVDITKQEIVAQKEEQVKVKERVDVTEIEIALQKREITDIKNNIIFLNQNFSDEKNEKITDQCSILNQLIINDDSSHLFQMKDSNWYLSCHHDEIDQPEVLINQFNRSLYAPGDKKVLKSYQCGYTKYDNEAGYAEYLMEKFDEQFGKDVRKQPWVLTNLHEDCVKNRNFYKLCKNVNTFCHDKKYSFLLIDISIEDNFKNLGFDIIKVKEQLKVYEAEDPIHRILVYIGECDIILNIRYIDSIDEKDISDVVRKGQNDTKLFCSLYKDVLQNTCINFVSLVILNAKTLKNLVTCSTCISENLIVPNEKLYSLLKHIVNTTQERNVKAPSSISTEITFVNLASRLWGSLSIRDIHLPHLRTDRDNALERIYLNRDQRQFLHSKKKHVILRGGYGSGKSLLAQEKFKYLIQNAKTTDDIFYLCFNNETLFKDFLKEQINTNVNHQLRLEQISIMNVDEYGKKFGLIPPYMFSEVLEDINERCKQSFSKPNVIADEYDSNNLTPLEAENIERNLQKMRNSFVLLIPQSLESVRKRVTKKLIQRHEEKYSGQEFERTGMAITMLDSIMRNTTSINKLSQATILKLERHTSKIDVSDFPVPVEENTKLAHSDRFQIHNEPHGNATSEQEKPESSSRNSFCMEKNPFTNETKMRIGERLDGKNHCDASKQDYRKSYNPQSESDADNASSTSVKNNLVDKEYEVTVSFYHVLKKINPIVETLSSRAIESRFRFPGKGKHGHKVVGKIPALINPFQNKDMNYDNINDSDMKMRLIFALENIVNIRKNYKGMAVIVFEPIEAHIFHAIFRSMEIDAIVYTPTISTGLPQTITHNMVNKLKDYVLLTDHVGARGLEFKHLLVTINPHETYLYQYLVEAFTRCLYDLSFIVFNTGVKLKGKFCSGNLIKVWQKKKLVQSYEIEVCEIHEEDGESMDLYCKRNHCYRIHTWHKDLRTAKSIERIEHPIESDEQLRVQYNRLLHHKYLEEDVRRKQDEQKFSKACARRGYKTYKDIICGNDKNIVDMLFKFRDCSYITKFRDVEGNTLLEIAFLNDCLESLKSMSLNGLQFPLPKHKICVELILANKEENVKFLLQCSKIEDVIKFQDVDGHSLLNLAFKHNCTKSLESIRSNRLQFPVIEKQTCVDVILSNKKENVELLIRCSKIDDLTHFQDADGNSLLDIAFIHCCTESIEAIDQFRFPFSVNYVKLTAKNKTSVIMLLIRLRRKQVLGYRDGKGNSLLHIATKNSWIHSVKLMAYCEIRIINNNDNRLPVDLAIESGNRTIIDLLNMNIDVKGIIKNYDDAGNKVEYLEGLIRKDRRDNLNVLLSNRDLIGEYESTLLYNAARYNKVYLFDVFIQFGCNMMKNFSIGNRDTILHIAARNSSEDVVKFIFEKYPQTLDMMSEYGDTILHLAVMNGEEELLKLILGKHLKIADVKNDAGKTILHLAIKYGREEMANLIIQRYPQMAYMKDYNGDTILHIAVMNGEEELLKLILGKYPKIVYAKNDDRKTILHYAIQYGREEMANLIIEKYPQMAEMKDKYGNTILHYAAMYGSKELMKLILEKFPQLAGVKDEAGATCFHAAALNGEEEIMKLILEKYPQMADIYTL